MFSKQKKWFSWLLVVTMLITIFPIHNLVFAAPGDNPSLDAAMNAITNPNTLLVALQNKDIKGKVNLDDIRAKFANAKVVNLENNFITEIVGSPSPAFDQVKSDGNLLTDAQRKITWPGTIERLKYNPQEIDVAAEYSQMMVAGKAGVTLQTLIDKGLIEKVTISVPGNVPQSYLEPNLNQAKISDVEIGSLPVGVANVSITVEYKGLPNRPEIFNKAVNVKSLKALEIEGLPAGNIFQPETDYTVYVSQVAQDDRKVPFNATSIAQLTVTPENPAMGYAEISKTLEADGRAKVVFKFQNEFDQKKLTFDLVNQGVSKEGTVSSKALQLESIKLIDSTVKTAEVTTAHPEKTQEMYIYGGTNISSFDSDELTRRGQATPLVEGKYYIKVKEVGKAEADLTDINWLTLTYDPNSKVSYELKQDGDGKVYLTASAQFDATGGATEALTLTPKAFGNNVSPLKIKVNPIPRRKDPLAYYIYEIDDVDALENDIQLIANEDITFKGTTFGETNTTKTKFYRVPLNNTDQDGLADFSVKEGKKKLYYPVAEYEVQGNPAQTKIRQVVPTSVAKAWYQKERFTANTFETVRPKPFEAVGSSYPGAPLEGQVAISSGLAVIAKSKTNPSLGNIGNVSLAMHHLNTNGLWFQVEWIERKVSNYVLIGEDHELEQVAPNPVDPPKPLSEYDMENVDDKAAVISEVRRATGDNGFASLTDKPNVKIPIGTKKNFKVLAIYDNGTVAEVGNTSELNSSIAEITKAGSNDVSDEDIQVKASPGVILELSATENGGESIGPSGKPTDGKIGNFGFLKFGETKIAKVILAPSDIVGTKLLMYDHLRLMPAKYTEEARKNELILDANGKPISGKIEGKWREDNSAQLYQGNASGQEALQTKAYIIPTFTNIDLNKIDSAATAEQVGESEVQKYAFERSHWSTDIQHQDGVDAQNGTASSTFRLLSAGQPSDMKAVGHTGSVVWKWNSAEVENPGTPTAKVKPYQDHDIKLDPALELRASVNIDEPIYDKMSAFAEKDGKKDPDFDETTKVLSMGLGDTKQIRIKLTNSNLAGIAAFPSLTATNFDQGVYFFGSDTVQASGDLEHKISDYAINPPMPVPPGFTGAFSDLYMLYLGSGQYTGLDPIAYNDSATPPYDGKDADRHTKLVEEQAKIVPKIYRKDVNGVYRLLTSDTSKLSVEANANVPGVFDISAIGRGDYRIVFHALHDGVESPLLAMDQDYLSDKELYYVDVNIDKAPIEEIYYYVVGDGISLEDNGRTIRVNTLNADESQRVFKVYPIIADAALRSLLPGGLVPQNLPTDFEGLKQLARDNNTTVEALLADPDSGLSYMKEEDFDLNKLASRLQEDDPKNVVIAQAERESNGNFFFKLFVQKADLSDATTNIGLDLQPRDFDKDPTAPPPVPEPEIVKPTGKFLPSTRVLNLYRMTILQELQDWIHDIRPKPLRDPAIIQRGESMPFEVTYITAKGVERDLTQEEVMGNVSTKLVITEDANNPELGVEAQRYKAEAGQHARLSFSPSKIGHYKFYLSTTNEKGQPVPAIGQIRVVEFEVRPSIKAEYDLYYGEALPIEVDAGDDTDALTFVPNTASILDSAGLTGKKLIMDETWAQANTFDTFTAATPVTVDVMYNGQKIGMFLVRVHPRVVKEYQLLPETSNTSPYLVNNYENIKLRIKRIFDNGSFDYIGVRSVEFISGYNTSFTESLDTEAESFITIDSVDPSKLNVRPVTGHNDADTWYAQYRVHADVPAGFNPWSEIFHVQKTKDPVNRPIPLYKFYRLEPNGSVTPVVSDVTIFERQTRPETLFVVDERDPNNKLVVSDYVLGVVPNGMVAYQQFGMTTSSAVTVQDLETAPNNYPRIKFNPLRAGNVSFRATDVLGLANEAVANYIIRQGQPLSVRILGPLNRSVAEGDTLSILAEVSGGVNPAVQWEVSTDGVTWSPVVGQTTARLTIPNVAMSMDGNMYRLTARDAYGSETTNSVAITVIPQTTPQTIEAKIVPSEHRKQVGQSADFRLQLTGAPAGATVTYEWKIRTSTGWVTPGVTTDTFSIPSVTADMHNNQYTCIVTVNGIPVNNVNKGLLVVVDANGNPIQTTHRVTFSAGAHGTLQGHGTSYSLTVVDGQSVLAADVPVVVAHSGYQFTGWMPANPAGTVVTAPMTFVAQYKATSGGGTSGGGGGPAPTPTPIPTPTPTPQQPQPVPQQPKAPVLQLNKNFKGAYISGYPDGTVRPSASITRAEVSAIFARIMLEQMVGGKAYPSQFKDVVSGKWYSDYIGFLEGFRILSGYPDGSFKPNNNITRAEFAVILSKFFELKTTNNKFTDVKENHWAKKYIDAAVANALMGGYPDGTFKPDRAITRAEVVTVINKAIERTPNKVEIDANPASAKRFKDLKPAHWAYYDVIEASTDHTK